MEFATAYLVNCLLVEQGGSNSDFAHLRKLSSFLICNHFETDYVTFRMATILRNHHLVQLFLSLWAVIEKTANNMLRYRI